jgi:Zn-finger nucleic acid-binding protein
MKDLICPKCGGMLKETDASNCDECTMCGQWWLPVYDDSETAIALVEVN